MTPEIILKVAQSQIGVCENPAGSNKVKYNTEYYGRPVQGSAYPWCCVFVWWVFKEAGAPELFFGGKKTAGATTLMNYYKQKGQLVKQGNYKPGDIVFFQFDNDAYADHVGIIEEVLKDGDIVTIEGNTSLTSDDNGGKVMRRGRTPNVIMAVAHPDYEKEEEVKTVKVALKVCKRGMKNYPEIKTIQRLLRSLGYKDNVGKIIEIDGSFGPATEAAVKKFQKDNKLQVDGKVGQKTWESLLS